LAASTPAAADRETIGSDLGSAVFAVFPDTLLRVAGVTYYLEVRFLEREIRALPPRDDVVDDWHPGDRLFAERAWRAAVTPPPRPYP
jgi:hypothetical protein